MRIMTIEDFINNCLLLIVLLLGPLLLLSLMVWFTVSAFLDIKDKLIRVLRYSNITLILRKTL